MNNYSLRKQMISMPIMLMLMIMMNTGCFSQGNNRTGQKTQKTPASVTSEQKTQIKTILSGYDPATLTAEQAKEIHEKFRAAGIHPGPETQDAIVAAGFDPEKLRTLAPPPGKEGQAGNKPPSLEERMKLVDEKIIKPLSLNSSQTETVNSAFKEFFTGMDKVRQSQESNPAPPDKSKIEPLEKSRDEKIKQVLTKEQFVKYKELEKSSRPPKPDQKGNK
jgi:hypothetical protein